MACGIAKYAEQQVSFLRREGHRVDVLSPPEGEGDFQVELLGGLRLLRLLKYLWAYDDCFIHFTPQFFYQPESAVSRILSSLALLLVMLFAGRRVSFLIHETNYRIGELNRGLLRHRIDRWYWRLARRVIFHSQRERDLFAEFYRLPAARPQFEVWPHEKFMVRRCPYDRTQAREVLGLRQDRVLLLCIGFIQMHKGYERPIEALQQVPGEHLALRIVGSVRLAWAVAHNYAQKLCDLADRDPRCQVIEGYLSDELFDTWIAAADYVIIPYHEIWTSGVAARCKLYGRPILAANTGGLAEQLTEGSALFSSDEELVGLIRQIAAEHAAADQAAAS